MWRIIICTPKTNKWEVILENECGFTITIPAVNYKGAKAIEKVLRNHSELMFNDNHSELSINNQ